jgi:Ca2+-binding RTX toxin-like protein
MFIALILGTLLAMLVAGGAALAATEPQPGECSPDVPTWCKGTDGADTLFGTPIGDRLEALAGADKVWGLGGTDALYGGAGNDAIHGDNAPDNYPPAKEVGVANWDALYGGNGADTLASNAGDDVLYAGNDNSRDVLRGGTGADVYVVDREAYLRGIDNAEARDADIIANADETLGDGVQLQAGESLKPQDLLDRVEQDGPLYFYPE